MRSRALVTLIMMVSAIIGAAGPADGKSTTCTGTLSGGTYPNLVVPEGVTCFVINAVVNGNVLTLENSKTFIINTTVHGNVEGLDAEMLQLINSTIDGNVEVVGGEVDDISPFTFDNAMCGTTVHGNVEVRNSGGDVIFIPLTGCPASHIDGNLRVEGNSARVVILNLTVGGNMAVLDTTGTLDKRVENNTVGGHLSCAGNDAPFSGGPNTAEKIHGQCF